LAIHNRNHVILVIPGLGHDLVRLLLLGPGLAKPLRQRGRGLGRTGPKQAATHQNYEFFHFSSLNNK
jgi:hypothetical protein